MKQHEVVKVPSIRTNEYVKNQIEAGEAREIALKDYLEGRGWTVEMTVGNFSDYDLSCDRDGLSLTIECKYNSGIAKYGTAFIETYQSGYPSGLQKTKADYQVHFSETGEVRGIKTAVLKEWITDNNPKLCSTKMKLKSGVVSGQGYRLPWEVLTLITTI